MRETYNRDDQAQAETHLEETRALRAELKKLLARGDELISVKAKLRAQETKNAKLEVECAELRLDYAKALKELRELSSLVR